MTRAALAAGLVAAALLPGEPLGVGVLVVAALVAVAVVRARRPSREAALFGGLALALASLAAVRDAVWVVALDLAAAWILATIATGGLALPAPLAPLVGVARERAAYTSAPAGTAPTVRGLALGSLVVAPFAALFLTGDAAFAELAGRIPSPSPTSVAGRAVAFTLVALAALGLGLAARRPLGPVPLRRPNVSAGPAEWMLALGLLDLLFLTFVVVQLTVLFGGRDHVLETAGLTYAEYARAGFWQLLAAAALTLAVVWAVAVFARTSRRRDGVLLRVGLAVLCALTLVVLASALRRLHLYEDAFGLTRARLVAEAAAFWIGGLVVLATAAALVPRARRLVAYAAVAGTAAGLLAFSLANPDGRVAERNVERYDRTGAIDVEYLAGLSADAVPALTGLPDPLADRALRQTSARLADDEPWSSWNLARHVARGRIEGL
jgi:Domain of unknown function (DUF4173)